MGDYQKAVANRSLRAIKTELEFLLDSDIITQAQFDNINNNLPASGAARANSSRGPVPATPTPEPPAAQLANLNVQDNKNEKVGYYGDNNVHNPPPPAYSTPPPAPMGPPALAQASAMYQYNAQDAGDLALMPNDRIQVTEYMNAEWWKGKNERTGQEGIFPRSYVRVDDQKSLVPATPTPPGPPAPSNYGNMPLDVSQGAASAPSNGQPGKGQEMGKKFGKKLGNAAIFGAGASIGGKIVNGIF